jgi:hypothetical protein
MFRVYYQPESSRLISVEVGNCQVSIHLRLK